MADDSRIDDLRRRVQKDPASIAFAQLAEEHRRAGQCEDAVQVCRAGLAIHPGYLSARVTLGRALLELGQLESAQHELELGLRVVERVELDERPAQRHAGREISRVEIEAGAADVDRFVEPARAPAFLGQLRERNRRRVFLDPASKVVNT